ncbi:hypothetical protein MMC17_001514 [Xylographa soralifera]|nr:hypothetical protein [Xylographa soralifera]
MAPATPDSLAASLAALGADLGFGTTARVIDPGASEKVRVVSTSGADNYHTYTGKAGNAGNGLFAAKSFESGELVLKLESDVTSVLDSPRLGVACEWCFVMVEQVDGEGDEGGDGSEGNVKLRKCGGCGVVRVCGEIFKRLHPKVLPNTVRLLLRLLLLRQNNVLPQSDWEGFLSLQHHLEDFKSQKAPQSDNTWENIQLMARAATEYSGTKEDMGKIEGMVGRILINSLTLVTPTYTPLGLSLSPTAALLNHSCTPNTCISFSGSTLSIRTLRPIPKDTELTISYIDITNPAATRRADLRSRYFFSCACPACSATPPQTLGRVDPPPALAAALSPTQLDGLETRARILVQESLDPAILAQGPSVRLKPLQEALALFAPQKTYPHYRQPLAALRAELVLVLLAAQQWVPALAHSLLTYFRIDPFLFPEAVHPVRVVHKWVLLKLVLQVAAVGQEGDEGVRALERKWGVEWGVVVWGLLMEVEGSVGGSHGVDSRFAAEVRREGDRFRVDARGGPYAEVGPGRRDVEREWAKLRKVADEGLAWWEDREEKRVTK